MYINKVFFKGTDITSGQYSVFRLKNRAKWVSHVFSQGLLQYYTKLDTKMTTCIPSSPGKHEVQSEISWSSNN